MSIRTHLSCRWCGHEKVSLLFTERKPRSVMRYWRCSECKGQFETIEAHASLNFLGKISHGRAILTEKDVLKILEKAKAGASPKELVKWSGMTRSTIGDILAKRTWKHI